MIITLTRTGGFAGIRRQYRVDLDAMEPEARAELESLVAGADFFSLPAQCRAPHADAFQYTIEVEDKGWRHEVTADERGAPPSLKPLLSRLVDLSRRSA